MVQVYFTLDLEGLNDLEIGIAASARCKIYMGTSDNALCLLDIASNLCIEKGRSKMSFFKKF
jgi:hypothetical protein